MNVIAVANRKGGAGKSTIATNLAAALALEGRRVLVIDMDSQGSATATLLDDAPTGPTMAHVMVGHSSLSSIIRPSTVAQVFIAPATDELTDAQLTIVNKPGREMILRRALRGVDGSYDVAIIDTAPERALGTVNALVAATHVLMPFGPDAKALEGLHTTSRAISEIVDAELSSATILGCVQVAHDTRLAVSCGARSQVGEKWGPHLFETAIRVNSSFVLCPAVHRPIFAIEKNSPRRGSEDMHAFAREVITRLSNSGARAAA